MKPNLNHLLAPIPVYPKKRVKINPITIKNKNNSEKLNIALGLIIIMMRNIGINTTNRIS